MRDNNKKVFVGISGGVDSAVAAFLLKQKGYDVTGVFIKTWTPDYIECTQKKDRLDAIRVCASLDIPFRELDLEKEYKTKVIDYFLLEYKKNRIPNPDIMCNKYIKFDAFYEYARAYGARIATGHYAKIDNCNEILSLAEPKDKSKDQVYFLYQIKKDILKNIIFPLSEITKKEVREIAKNNNLPVANKKDSQGICMLGGDISIKDFLIRETGVQKGFIKNQLGQIIGEHDGVILYTIGERHGFRIDTKSSSNIGPYYVIDKDLQNNVLIVSNKIATKNSDQIENIIALEDCNFFVMSIDILEDIYVAFRYRGEKVICNFDSKNNFIILRPESLSFYKEFVSGQSAVLYNKSGICLGGGVII